MMETHEYNNNIEYQKAIQFLKKGCKCGCSSQLPSKKFVQLRVQIKSLPRAVRNSFVMGQLLAMKEGDTTNSSRFPKKQRTNLRIFYRWDNKTPICQETYLNMLGVSRDYLEVLVHEVARTNVKGRIHGNTGRMPQWKTKTAINENVKKQLKIFIENYAEKYGFPNSGRTKRANKITTFLPTEMSYKSVHQNFLASLGEDSNLKSLKYEAFRRLWHQLTPHIKFLNPRTDLCDTCHEFRSELHSCQDEATKTQIKKNLIPSRKS